MRKLSWIFVVFLVVGCTPSDRDEFVTESSKAGTHIAKAATIAWSSLDKELKNVNLESSRKAIEDAQKKAIQAKKDFDSSSGKSQQQLKELQAQIERLRAALDVKKLQEQVDDLTKKAKKANETVDQTKSRLEKADQDYQTLQTKLNDAMKQYDSLMQTVNSWSPTGE